MDDDMQGLPDKKNWIIIILILISLWIASAFLANLVSIFKTAPTPETQGNVAIIPVKGTITADAQQSTFGRSAGAGATQIVNWLEKAESNNEIQAVILEINSPGGTAVASEEIAKQVKEMNKTTVAWIREVGASGAYWVSSAADHIVASKVSTTGSIGVIASYLEYSGLLDRFNITYQRLVGGKYKDIGSPFKNLTKEEREILMDKIEMVHEHFINRVAENRNMSQSEVEEFANGLAYMGGEAEDLGLVDEIGGKEEAINYIEEKHNITVKTTRFQQQRTLLDVFGNLISQHGYYMGKGIKDALTKNKNFVART